MISRLHPLLVIQIVVTTIVAVSYIPNATASPSDPALLSFVPNQCAGNVWYRPGSPPSLINGHLDSSFGNREQWPNLIRNLKKANGSFSLFAAEIGCMSSKTGVIPLLRAERVPISVELPGFTQAIDGDILAGAELDGKAVGQKNIFADIFTIKNVEDRTDPYGHGWFVTRDGKPFVPDEILFDERIPNLLPVIDPNVLAGTPGDWAKRKAASSSANPYVAGKPYKALLVDLMNDYVKFLKVAKARWGGKMPAVSLHWNVNPGWEWRDEAGLDAIYAKEPDYFAKPQNFWAIVANRPQYNSVIYLNDLIDVLTKAGFKPKTVFMDVDWTYDIPYITETLRRHKTALKTRGVQMGINVVEASIGDQDELVCEAGTLKRHTDSVAAPNLLYENTLIAIMDYLKVSGVYEKGMQMRVGSWSHRPYETGSEVDEKRPGSLAHTANRIAELL